MTLTIRPDLRQPAGGYAVLSLPDDVIPTEEVTVAIQNTFSERWLAAGPPGHVAVDPGADWLTVRSDFGPYRVNRRNGRCEVTVGPEITNRIRAYTRVRVLLGNWEGSVAWPEEVLPAAEPPGGDEIQGAQPGALSPNPRAPTGFKEGAAPVTPPLSGPHQEPRVAPRPPLRVVPPLVSGATPPTEPKPLPPRQPMPPPGPRIPIGPAPRPPTRVPCAGCGAEKLSSMKVCPFCGTASAGG